MKTNLLLVGRKRIFSGKQMSFYAWCCVKKKYHHIGSVNISVYKKNSELVVCVFLYNRAGKPLAHVPKIAHREISLTCSIHCCPNFLLFLLPDQHLNILKKCLYIHIPDCVETVYELLLLSDNTGGMR